MAGGQGHQEMLKKNSDISFFFFKILFIYLFIYFREGKGGRKKGEKQQCVVASCMLPTGDLSHNPGMCHGWELNLQPFGSQSGAQSTEPHRTGQNSDILME